MDTEIRDIVASGTKVVGTIEGKEPLLVLGEVEGKIVLDNLLVVGKSARIKAEVRAKAVTVEGTLEGSIHASEVVALVAGSRLTGDVYCPRLVVEDKAVFDGSIHMNDDE
jgi:cytoskeletal protein CcmA (bactofilin family)